MPDTVPTESQPVTGPAQPQMTYVSADSETDILGKLAVEVIFRKIRHPAQPFDTQRLVQVLFDVAEDLLETLRIGFDP